MEKKDKKFNRKIFLLITIAVVVILAGLLICTHFYIEGSIFKSNNNIADIKVEEEFNVNKDEEEKTISIIDAYKENKNMEYTGPCNNDIKSVTHNITIPKINSNKTNALELNNKIMNTYKNYINDDGKQNINIDYKYLIKDNYIYINISIGMSNFCGTGYSHTTGFYYDILNDKIMNSKEAFNSVGFTLSDLKNNAIENKDVSFEECDISNDTGYGCYIDVSKENISIYYNNSDQGL